MSGNELRDLRQAAGFGREVVAAVAGFSTGRLAAIEREQIVEDETVERVRRAVAILGGLRRRLARELVGAADRAMRAAV